MRKSTKRFVSAILAATMVLTSSVVSNISMVAAAQQTGLPITVGADADVKFEFDQVYTGKVTVEKFTCVADVGTIMNRLLVEGNFYGGLVQGIGLALSEDFEDLNHDTTLKNCGIPYPKDAPDDIELHFNETYRPSGPYGAAGCGEAPLDAPHPAILNAIFNATGARITRIPARPERVLSALKELEK